MLATTTGIVVPLPSLVARSTSSRDATADRPGHQEHVAVGQVVRGRLAGKESHVSIACPIAPAGYARTACAAAVSIRAGCGPRAAAGRVAAGLLRHHGGDQPDPGLLLRPRRHLRARRGAGGRGPGGRRGADILDIGGVKAGPGDEVSVAEEIRRVAGLVAARARAPPRAWSSAWTPGGREVGRGGRRGRRGPAQRRLGRRRSRRWPRWPPTHGLGPGLLARGRPGAAAPGRTAPPTPTWSAEVPRYVTAEAERAVAAGVRPGRHRHRPGARLRQEHLALAGADPAARRAGGHRVAGAGRGVEQGLRRGDAGPGRHRAGRGHARGAGGLRLGGRAGCSACTTCPPPGTRCDVAALRGRRRRRRSGQRGHGAGAGRRLVPG